MTGESKIISINEKLFKVPAPGEDTQLIGSRCKSCGEAFFPRRNNCTECFSEDVEEIALSKKGKIFSYTIVHNATPGFLGKVPYAVAAVELPEDLIILSPMVQCDFSKLKVGMDVEMVFEKLYADDKGNDVISYMFKPVE